MPKSFSSVEMRMVLGVQYELAIRRIINTTAYVLIDDIDTEMIALLNDGKYFGAKVNSSSVREYNTTYAAHILGSVSRIYEEDYATLKEQGYAMDDWIGRDGAEAAFEQYLRGVDGRRTVYTNADGKITSELYTKEPKPGSTVELTIDLAFQQAVEDALADTVESMTAADEIGRASCRERVRSPV